jgi:glucuronate isomerase
MLAKDILQGKIPEDYDLVGSMIQNICYYNAKSHFKF